MGIHDRFLTLSAEGHCQWTPREKRYVIENLTTVTTATGKSDAAIISNLSNGGCRIVTHLALRPRERLKLIVEPLGLVEAEVRWTAGNEAGLELIYRNPFHSDYELSYPP